MGVGRIGWRCRQTVASMISVAAMAFCLPVWGLGLQEVELSSRLNQPLQFTLDILQQSKVPVAAQHVHVRIASPATYQQRGLVYPAFLNDISLSVSGAERLQIQGRSTLPLREPVLYLLFELQWPGGSALVQRSVIVDLQAQLLPQEKTLSQPEKIERATALAPSAVAGPEGVVDVSQQGEQRHRVQRGEILSLLASEYRGAVDIPLHRYIRAIQQLNAEAFPSGLDQLTPGQVIRMPDPVGLLSDTTVVLPVHGDSASIDYIVQYGDKFSLLAQHFRGNADMPLKAYMQQIVAANAGVLDMSGGSLKSGMLLHIPRPAPITSGVAPARQKRETAVLAAVFEPREIHSVELEVTPPSVEKEEDFSVGQELQVVPAGQEFELADTAVVTTDLNAYRDSSVAQVPAVLEATESPLKPNPVSATERGQQEWGLRQWIIYALWLLLVFVVIAIVIAVVKTVKKNNSPVELAVLPSLLPDETESVEDELDHDAMQDSIALLGVVEESGHQATVRMHANDYLQKQAEGAGRLAKFASAEQNTVEKLIADGELAEAAKKVDQLIYSQSGDLKNWLLKLEVLAKQGKRQRCHTLAAQVCGSFSAADQQLAVEQILEQYFSGSVDAEGFVPEDYNPSAQRRKSAAAELASETAEVRVYLSYGFYDMAEQALETLMQDFPRHIDLRILRLEVLLGTGNEQQLQRDAYALLQGAAKLSQAQEYQIKELLERAGNMSEAVSTPEMDLDLSEPTPENVVEHDVIDLDLSAGPEGDVALEAEEGEVAYLDQESLDWGSEITDALHREEDAYHKAHDAAPDIDMDLQEDAKVPAETRLDTQD